MESLTLDLCLEVPCIVKSKSLAISGTLLHSKKCNVGLPYVKHALNVRYKKSCVCFQHAKPNQAFYLVCCLHVESIHRICASLCYLCNIAIFQYVTQNSTFTRQNTIHFIIFELIPIYALVWVAYVHIKVI